MISKLQYNNYETGEFSEEKERSQEEIISLVHNFPWEKQRDYFVVGLTSPSVTIEDNEGNYLKLALYYHGKFIIYYRTTANKLYTHTATNIEEFKSILLDFTSKKIDSNSFKNENYLSIDSSKHFVTNDFLYRLSSKRNLIYFFFRTGTGFIVIPFLLLLIKAVNNAKTFAPIIFLSIVFLIFVGLPLFFFLNYYIYSKNWNLIISRGNEYFYFGLKSDMKQYAKKDIEKVKVYGSSNGRTPLAGFSLIKIILKNGEELIVPNILIDENTLIKKFKPELIMRVNQLILAKKRTYN
ncbi:hypothetical protein [Rhizosphaericola mali]|uniref:PH domain-containing protein n=1 Tax=Rhizosphaericola mali TaxID=2545455 RepID=A0A5P2GD26_9BACT|nr:hypothetical protein [Rhizosphaericola mali]QES89491.1 hypothetical protein E0W69_012750 [Rhizosphaericola mali]